MLSLLGFAKFTDNIYPTMQKLMRNKRKDFSWTDEAQVPFENIKREFFEAPVLGMPTEKRLFKLETDALVAAARAYSIRNKNGRGGLFSDP